MKLSILLPILLCAACAADAPKPKDIKSCKQIWEEVPKDQRPPAGRWEGPGVGLAHDWITKNIPGRNFKGKIKYMHSQVLKDDDGNPKGVEAYFLDQSTEVDGLGVSTITCNFDVSKVAYFVKLKLETDIAVEGPISSAKASGGGKFALDVEIFVATTPGK